jgi:D-alanyl-D-alanine carboxypeptidase
MTIQRITLGLMGLCIAACGAPQTKLKKSSQKAMVKPLASKSVPVQRLDKDAEGIRASGKLPALGMAVIDADGIWALGLAGQNHATGRPVRAQDRFHLGSNTKSMTATLVARLVERGLLKWDTPLSALFPKLEIHPKLSSVTLEQLLRHEGGMTAWTDPTKVAGDWALFKSETLEGVRQDRLSLAALLLKRGPNTPIGGFVYSNAGYVLVGAALEGLTKMSWEKLMKVHVFEPLKMQNCGFGPTATKAAPDNIRAHRFKDGQFVAIPPGPLSDNPPALGPAGTIHCDLESWARYLRVHLGFGPEGFLKPATINHLHRPSPASKYAFGWMVPSPVLLMHEGSNTMNHAIVMVSKKNEEALVVVTNAGPPPSVQPSAYAALKVLMNTSIKAKKKKNASVVTPTKK